jgi:phosphotriesterase-related protein
VGIVRTVLGDVEPADLGVTYCHEHLIIDSPIVARDFPHIHLPSVDEAAAEVELCFQAGVRTMVDAMPEGGRDIERLREVSRRTGMHVVSATGRHTEKYYGIVSQGESPEYLAGRFVADIDSGCGVIKVATGPGGIDDRARRVFEAAAIAHQQTGAPIITHCEEGLLGMEQIELLVGMDVRLGRVLLSHTDKVIDPGYHSALLEAGVNLEYDQALRQSPDSQGGTVWLLVSMVEAGFSGQLVLGTDGARRTLWRSLGGSPGLSWLLDGFIPILEKRGITPETKRRLLVENPRRWLTFA